MSRRGSGGSLYKQPGCATYMLKYYRDGKCIRQSTGLTNFKAAQQELNKRVGRAAEGIFAGLKVERIRVVELLEDFLRDYRQKRRKSVGHAEARCRKHLSPFFATLRVTDVSSDVINRYVDQRMQEGAQSATINRELAALKRMFRIGYYGTPPKVFRLPAFPRLEENPARSGFLEDTSYAKLTAAISELWLRTFIQMAHTYGWRKGELLNLRVRHVDLIARTIRLDPGTTKNQAGREVAMTNTVAALIASCVEGKKTDDFVFTRADGKPVRDFRKAWRKACAAADVPDTLVHDMRRTAARNFRRAGIAEGVIMKIGGWKTSSVFKRYDIVNQADCRDALYKLEQAQKESSNDGHDCGHDSPETDSHRQTGRVN